MQTKDKLAYMVMVEQNKVSSAAKVLKINDSTAKMTIRAFKLLPPDEQRKILLNGAVKKKNKNMEPTRPGHDCTPEHLHQQAPSKPLLDPQAKLESDPPPHHRPAEHCGFDKAEGILLFLMPMVCPFTIS
jgi:hypothetical protein